MSVKHEKSNYDAEFCGNIPINFINSIQPYGILMVLEKSELKIMQVSENTARLLDVPAEEMLNQPLSDFVGAESAVQLKQQLDKWNIKESFSANLHFTTGQRETDFAVTMHDAEKYFLAELREIREPELNISFVGIYQRINNIMRALKEAEDIKKISDITVKVLKEVSGFDKVMLYAFDEAWNGTVMAEEKEAGMASYLDLRFPASDVPKQARDLYFKNPFRLIPDTSATPARLVPVLNPVTHSFIDLSHCNLRGVSKVHIEYLHNMGVAASVSVPLIVQNRLWGLISCHHKTPKFPEFEVQAAFELLSTVVSAQIAAKETEMKLKYKTEVDQLKIKILEQLYEEHDLSQSFFSNADDLLKLFRVNGASLVLENKIINTGETPDDQQIKDLVRWLRKYQQEKIFTTRTLSQEHEAGQNYKDIASGLMALNISQTGEYYFLGYRPEVIHTVEWGGNPNKAIIFEEDGKAYHPRNSFNVWKETVRLSSFPWREEEIEAADKLRAAMLEKMYK